MIKQRTLVTTDSLDVSSINSDNHFLHRLLTISFCLRDRTKNIL